jgi:hypothetical protein
VKRNYGPRRNRHHGASRALGIIPTAQWISVTQQSPFAFVFDRAAVSWQQLDFLEVLREVHPHRYGVVAGGEYCAEVAQLGRNTFPQILNLRVDGTLAAATLGFAGQGLDFRFAFGGNAPQLALLLPAINAAESCLAW